MFRRLPLVTVLLGLVSLGFVALIVKELSTPQRLPRMPAAQSPAASPPSPSPAAPAAPAAGGYAVVVNRNLFSPTRTEAPPPPPKPPGGSPPPVVNLPKPSLYGVVLQEGTPVAYLEDPTTKRVARYRVGDHLAGGTVQTINSDSVVLSRPDGQISVRLHDPTRPRPAATPPQVPGPPPREGQSPAPTAPGAPIPAPGAMPGGQRSQDVGPSGTSVQTRPPGRRPLPPGVLGRTLPQGTDASTPQ